MNYKFIILLIIIPILLYFYYIKNETFNNKIIQNKPYIWMYWENYPGKTRPVYLDICLETIQKNCSRDFNIVVLDEILVYNYLPNLRKDLSDKLNINQKTDIIRIELLYKYGGIWMDFDTIVTRNLLPIIKKLKKWDFVGFGCHTGYNCSNGHPKPANWVMASNKNTELMKIIKETQNKIFQLYTKDQLKINYHILGRTTLWNTIQYLQQHNNWDYYHWDSKCLERDSIGNILRNDRTISYEDIDKKCLNKMLFVPIYNSAPGFPKWFLKLTRQQLLNSDMLISKLFRLSLGIKN